MSKENDRDSKGRFLKGNQNSAKTGEYKSFKHKCKQNIYDALTSLNKPISTIKEDLANEDATRWEYIVAYAVSKGNTKFIQWLFEMGIGRPKHDIEIRDLAGLPNITITLPSNNKEAK